MQISFVFLDSYSNLSNFSMRKIAEFYHFWMFSLIISCLENILHATMLSLTTHARAHNKNQNYCISKFWDGNFWVQYLYITVPCMIFFSFVVWLFLLGGFCCCFFSFFWWGGGETNTRRAPRNTVRSLLVWGPKTKPTQELSETQICTPRARPRVSLEFHSRWVGWGAGSRQGFRTLQRTTEKELTFFSIIARNSRSDGHPLALPVTSGCRQQTPSMLDGKLEIQPDSHP